MKNCILIAVEGPDGVGKFTQAYALHRSLENLGYSVCQYEIPYTGSAISYDIICDMLHTGWAKKFPTLFQIAHFINKFFLQFLHFPVKEENQIIILDRWTISMLIYGKATGANNIIIKMLSKLLAEPDITFILVGDNKRKISRDSFEADTNLQKNVKTLYNNFTNQNMIKINANQNVFEIHSQILIRVIQEIESKYNYETKR